jgi:hypothetical protein
VVVVVEAIVVVVGTVVVDVEVSAKAEVDVVSTGWVSALSVGFIVQAPATRANAISNGRASRGWFTNTGRGALYCWSFRCVASIAQSTLELMLGRGDDIEKLTLGNPTFPTAMFTESTATEDSVSCPSLGASMGQ